jgi:AcrR family transcriptional regulator
MPRKKLLSDADVLAAAGRVFARVGPSRFTLADVASEAGLAPATLVQRFGSKRALMLAFAEHAASEARRPFEQALAEGGSALEALRTALVHAMRAANDRQELAHSLAFLVEDLADPALGAYAAQHARWTEASIRVLLQHAAARGELVGADPARLAHALQAAWNGAMIQWALRGKGSLVGWIGAVVDTLLSPYVARETVARVAVAREAAARHPRSPSDRSGA